MGDGKTPWSERSPGERVALLALIGASLALVGAAERDIARRPQAEVRGSRTVWRALCLNALGAVAYLVWGRKR